VGGKSTNVNGVKNGQKEKKTESPRDMKEKGRFFSEGKAKEKSTKKALGEERTGAIKKKKQSGNRIVDQQRKATSFLKRGTWGKTERGERKGSQS